MAENTTRLSRRNLFAFSIGTFGRDMACAGLFMGQLLNYVYFTRRLTGAQLAAITVLMAAAKIFDALNDPVMGNIVDGTRSRWGKFKPWITIGMFGSAAVILATFCTNLQGWAFVTLFGFMYFAYSIVFTMNDTAYWGMIPSLARNADDRNRLTGLTAFFANMGGGACGILIPILTTGALAINGSAVTAYRYTSVIFVVIFLIFQSITILGVKEDETMKHERTGKIGLHEIIETFKLNDQLRWACVIFFLTQILPSAAYTMYIYFRFGYNGTLATLFYIFGSIATVCINLFLPQLSRKFKREGLMKIAAIFMVIGCVAFLGIELFVPTGPSFTIPVFEAVISVKFFLDTLAYFFIGAAGCLSYMTCMILIANTSEYHDMLTGKRNEGLIFSCRSFLVKLGSAINTFVVMLFYILIGINEQTNKIADLEQQANLGEITGDQKLAAIEGIIAEVPDSRIHAICALIAITSAVLYVAHYLVFKKKYKIDEAYFDELTRELAARDAAEAAQ